MKKWFIVFFLFVITLFQSLQTVSAETVEWKERADLPEPRVGASSGVVDGKIYVIGGGTEKPGNYGNQTFVYDPKTNEWTRKADMPTEREELRLLQLTVKFMSWVEGQTMEL